MHPLVFCHLPYKAFNVLWHCTQAWHFCMPIGHEFTARGTDSVRICLAIKGNGHTPVKVQYADCVPSVAFIYTFWVSSIDIKCLSGWPVHILLWSMLVNKVWRDNLSSWLGMLKRTEDWLVTSDPWMLTYIFTMRNPLLHQYFVKPRGHALRDLGKSYRKL